MRKTALSWISLIFLCFSFNEVSAAGMQLGVFKTFKLQTYVDGNATDTYIVGTIIITRDRTKVSEILWEHVKILPVHNARTVKLYPEHFYSREERIININYNDNNFSFQLILTPDSIFDIEGTILPFTINGIDKNIEWRQVNNILLPYSEVQ